MDRTAHIFIRFTVNALVAHAPHEVISGTLRRYLSPRW
jgi:hypothetical protein